jgi:D-beta-D-heptose 7-phosphate kinase/D-beta-D-heptose 1-phosphate adenosyltransferase
MRAAAVILETPLLIVTDGSRGVGWCLRGQTGFLASPKKYSSGNCVGAGDTFFAGLLLGFSELGNFDCRTMAVEQVLVALKIALVAAGQRVRANGDKPFDAKKILRETRKDTKRDQKVMSPPALKKFVESKRAQGKSIVFANGCFDLLHAGHLQLLEFAKQQGDVLVVAVDSDDNVRALKGPTRPVQDQSTRAGNIAALASVDAVCIFGETMPDATLTILINCTNPDVLVKGEDYATKQVVGSEMVEGRGGRIALCPLLPGTSTTALVNKIRMTT